MFLRVLQFVFSVAIAVLVATEIFIPALLGRPLFPLYHEWRLRKSLTSAGRRLRNAQIRAEIHRVLTRSRRKNP